MNNTKLRTDASCNRGTAASLHKLMSTSFIPETQKCVKMHANHKGVIEPNSSLMHHRLLMKVLTPSGHPGNTWKGGLDEQFLQYI